MSSDALPKKKEVDAQYYCTFCRTIRELLLRTKRYMWTDYNYQNDDDTAPN